MYTGKGEEVDGEWYLKSEEVDDEDNVQRLSSRWLDVASGRTVQPAQHLEFDHQVQLLNAQELALEYETAATEDRSEDEWDDPLDGLSERERYHCDYAHELDEEPRDCR